MKTTKTLFLIATLLCSTGLTACGDGISSSFEDFGALCKASGGDVVEEKDNVCKCDKDCTTGVVCIEGKCADSVEKKCNENQEPYCEDDSLYSCDNGILVQTSCPNGCLNNECRDCNDGDTKCEDDGIKTCKDGVWGESDNSCGDNGCLSDKSACAECREDETPCSDGQYQLCVAGRLSTQKISCASGICAQDGTSCADCRDNETQCDSASTYRQCIDGKWTESQSCEKLCNDGQCVDSCAENSTLCISGNLSTCIDSKWNDPKTCEGNVSCKNTSDCGECENTKKKCENSYISICENGEWVKVNPCSKENSCNEDGSDCGECKNDDTICAGEKIRTCANGVWGTPADCGSGEKCDAETGKCSSTKPVGPDEKCSDNIQQVCVNNDKYLGTKYKCDGGKVTFTEDCKNIDGEKVSCAGNECGECKNDDTKCKTNVSNNGEYTYIKFTCDKGKWSKEQNCEQGYECNQINTDCVKKSSGNCPGNVPYCESNNVLAYCDDNGNLQNKICDSKLHCYGSEGNAYCGECENGSKTCVENTKKLCENGKWNEITCPNGCSSDGECAPQNACTDGEYTCKKDGYVFYKVYECINHEFQSTTYNEICRENDSGTHFYECQNEKLIVNDCGQNSCKENVCGECKNDERKCENGFSYLCQKGDWGFYDEQCKYGCDVPTGSCATKLKEGLQCYNGLVKCDGANNIYYCNEGGSLVKSGCYNNIDNVGQVCNSGSVQDCFIEGSGKFSCDSSGSACGKCLNGTVCEIKNSGLGTVKYKKCDNGVYKDCSYSGSGDIGASISCGESVTVNYPECPQ